MGLDRLDSRLDGVGVEVDRLVVFQIVIPFFSLLIKDIYFLNEGCASRLTTGHINFEVSPGVEVKTSVSTA